MDLALRDVARALLANRPEDVDAAVARVEAQESERLASGEGWSGALPYALDARHALVDDPGLYRALSSYLLERGDMTPELRARLAQEVADDPLSLADARIREARTLRFGGAFNALADLYAGLATAYVERHPPESLRFDPPAFEELASSASRLYEAVANQDGATERMEASRRLEAFLAFTLRVDRDRFSQ